MDIVIFDLDGTLADIEHRLQHIKNGKKNWNAFFKACPLDLPIVPTIKIAQALSHFHLVYIWTGRSEIVEVETRDWLMTFNISFNELRMRPEGDYRPDHELKEEWLLELTAESTETICAFEDRKRVVDMWRKHGIPCYHVAEGDF